MRKIFAVFFVSLVFVSISCNRETDKHHELKLSLILGENSDWYKGAVRFAELVEERTGGSCRVKIFPHAQLAGQSQRTELEMLQTGVIDISLESSILLTLIEKRMGIFSLPWMFDNYEEAYRILDSPLGQHMLDLLAEKEITGLAYGANGFRQITNSINPIRTPADISGMKLRVPGIKMYIDIFKLLDADPSSMNFGELFTALAQGTMDGQENPVSVIYSARLFEVQRYLTLWNYSFDPVILCVNKKLWETLEPDIRNIISWCARDAMKYERESVAQGEPSIVDSLKSKGMEINTLDPASVRAFKTIVEPIYHQFDRQIGGGLVDKFRNAVE
ncbi:MAG: DctP family TRAP transporter solute-binding subunit [Candidatus Latescibacteria bacterium]|nr:DctP family TRAP transporter solute-binding subunit [Candidatus Latescibacterota bacterium]